MNNNAHNENKTASSYINGKKNLSYSVFDFKSNKLIAAILNIDNYTAIKEESLM